MKQKKPLKLPPHEVNAANAVALPDDLGAVVLWDRANPRSVINLVPQAVQASMQKALAEKPELFTLDEQDLYRTLRKNGCTPTATDNRIRMRFWMEYDYAQLNYQGKIDMSRVLSAVCSDDYFYNKYLHSLTRVAWLFCPPTAYMVKCEEALEFGIEQLRDILEQPHTYYDAGGNLKIDTALGGLKAKIVATLDNRVKGAVVQKTMNVHLGTDNKDLIRSMAGTTMEDLQKKLTRLKTKEKQLSNGGMIAAQEPIDVTTEEEKATSSKPDTDG